MLTLVQTQTITAVPAVYQYEGLVCHLMLQHVAHGSLRAGLRDTSMAQMRHFSSRHHC